jgi:hypothetical protein
MHRRILLNNQAARIRPLDGFATQLRSLGFSVQPRHLCAVDQSPRKVMRRNCLQASVHNTPRPSGHLVERAQIVQLCRLARQGVTSSALDKMRSAAANGECGLEGPPRRPGSGTGTRPSRGHGVDAKSPDRARPGEQSRKTSPPEGLLAQLLESWTICSNRGFGLRIAPPSFQRLVKPDCC